MRLLKGWIPEDVLQKFEYKYKSSDLTWLEKNILDKWWEFVIKLTPTNIAPNLITFTGFLAMTIPFSIFLYSDPTFSDVLP